MMNKAVVFIAALLLIAGPGCRKKASQPSTPSALQTYFAYADGRPPLISAHRGGKGYPGYPENCLETMQYILDNIPGAIFEVDVAQTRDGKLVLLHDESLDRTTSGTGKIKRHTWKDLEEVRLEDESGSETPYKIPLFGDVLDWAKEKNAILMVDIKRSVDNLEVLKFIEKKEATDQCVLITYSADAAIKLHRHNPGIMLSVSIRNYDELSRMAKTGIPFRNMVAFTGTRESPPELYEALHQKKVMCILGTLGNLDNRAKARGDQLYREFRQKGIDIFATDRPLEAAEALSLQETL